MRVSQGCWPLRCLHGRCVQVLIFELEIIEVKSDAIFTWETISAALPLLAIAAVSGGGWCMLALSLSLLLLLLFLGQDCR